MDKQNIERYRKPRETRNAAERRQIVKLLAEEKAKFKLELRNVDLTREPSRMERRPASRHHTCARYSAAGCTLSVNSDASKSEVGFGDYRGRSGRHCSATELPFFGLLLDGMLIREFRGGNYASANCGVMHVVALCCVI